MVKRLVIPFLILETLIFVDSTNQITTANSIIPRIYLPITIYEPTAPAHSSSYYIKTTDVLTMYDSAIPLTQISKLLGHSSLAVTQRYLNIDLNLEETISDFVPFD